MNLLLDTQILIWTLQDNPRLSSKARKLILNENNKIFFSYISLWEIQIKHMIHPKEIPSFDLIEKLCKASGFESITLNSSDIRALSSLKPIHKDPFDRILICQAKTRNFLFLSADSILENYGESFLQIV